MAWPGRSHASLIVHSLLDSPPISARGTNTKVAHGRAVPVVREFVVVPLAVLLPRQHLLWVHALLPSRLQAEQISQTLKGGEER